MTRKYTSGPKINVAIPIRLRSCKASQHSAAHQSLTAPRRKRPLHRSVCGPARHRRPSQESSIPKHFGSPLPGLLTEIRLKILRILLWQKEALRVEDGCSGMPPRPHQDLELYPNILRTCKQLLGEGWPILIRQYDTVYCGGPASPACRGS